MLRYLCHNTFVTGPARVMASTGPVEQAVEKDPYADALHLMKKMAIYGFGVK